MSNYKNICCDHTEIYSIVNYSVTLWALRCFEQTSDGLTLPVCHASILFVKYTEIVEGTNNLFGTAVAQWLRYCATNLKVAFSIPGGVISLI
jgi:hypothetical protein